MKIKILIMMAAALSLWACHNHQSHDHSENKMAEGEHAHADEIVLSHEQIENSGIKAETVHPGPFKAALLVSGQIVSGQGDEHTVVATSSGVVRLANASIAEGTAVSAGQTVAYVSARNLQDGDPSAKARATYEAAKAEYERAKQLVADRIVSEKEFSQIRMQYETARIAYEAQSRQMTSGGVAVVANMGGYVKSLLVRQGEYVSVGQSVMVVAKSRRLQLRADVPTTDLDILTTVSTANFRVSGSREIYSLDALHGRMLSYARNISEGSSFVPVTFEFDNIGHIVSGAFAEVWLQGSERQGVISVPVESLTEEQGVKYVYLQVEDHAFIKREVTPGESDGRRVEIVSGLSDGDKVVTRGAYQVKLASASAVIPSHSHNH